jgi:hypothetical protein
MFSAFLFALHLNDKELELVRSEKQLVLVRSKKRLELDGW